MKWKNRASGAVMGLVLLVFAVYAPGNLGLFFLCAMAVQILAGVLFVLLSARKLRIRLAAPESCGKGEEFQGMLQIWNDSIIPMSGQCSLEWKNELTGEKGNLPVKFSLGSRGEAELPFGGNSAYCGRVVFRVKELVCHDPAGLFFGKRKKEAAGETFILPEIHQTDVKVETRETYDMESVQYSQTQKGDDVNETFALREYRWGDSMHRVHWKLTEKLGTVMVRESGYPIQNSILLLMETGMEKQQNPALLNAVVELSAALTHSLAEQDQSFEVGVFDYEKDCLKRIRVDSEERVFEADRLFVCAGRKESSRSALWHYLSEEPEGGFAHYLYVTAGAVPEELWLLKELGEVSVLTFRKEETEMPGIYRFSEEIWEEQLNGLSL